MSEPQNIKEVHNLLKRMQDNKKVDADEIAYYLKKAVNKKDAHGVWIKREEDKSEESISVVRVDYEKQLIAMRVNGKKNK